MSVTKRLMEEMVKDDFHDEVEIYASAFVAAYEEGGIGLLRAAMSDEFLPGELDHYVRKYAAIMEVK